MAEATRAGVREVDDLWYAVGAFYMDGELARDEVKIRPGMGEGRVSIEIAGVVREVYTRDLGEAVSKAGAAA